MGARSQRCSCEGVRRGAGIAGELPVVFDQVKALPLVAELSWTMPLFLRDVFGMRLPVGRRALVVEPDWGICVRTDCMSLLDIAGRLGLVYATVRTRLKQVS
jgi:hypothetical protein